MFSLLLVCFLLAKLCFTPKSPACRQIREHSWATKKNNQPQKKCGWLNKMCAAVLVLASGFFAAFAAFVVTFGLCAAFFLTLAWTWAQRIHLVDECFLFGKAQFVEFFPFGIEFGAFGFQFGPFGAVFVDAGFAFGYQGYLFLFRQFVEFFPFGTHFGMAGLVLVFLAAGRTFSVLFACFFVVAFAAARCAGNHGGYSAHHQKHFFHSCTFF